MKAFIKALKKIALEMIANDSNKEKVIKHLNSKFDLPIISEKTEKEFLESMYDAMMEALIAGIEDNSKKEKKDAKG
jgi:nickel-dependent lactate racemase|tara:strand:- start:230 stop:457 length:228 start_codon:yes stop_codon:yes gene_type:complete